MLSNLMSYGLRLREPIRSDAARRTPNVRSFYSNGNNVQRAHLAFNTSVTKKEGHYPSARMSRARTVTIFAVIARSTMV